MKVYVRSGQSALTARLGPMCIACGNSRRFWVQTQDGEAQMDVTELPDGLVRVVKCGRCSSRNSIVIATVN
ncbi:MAG: hypothetical protein NVSMB52_14670 [Chloroflexota bacterium]